MYICKVLNKNTSKNISIDSKSFFLQRTDFEWIPAEWEGNLNNSLQKTYRLQQSPSRSSMLKKPKYTLSMLNWETLLRAQATCLFVGLKYKEMSMGILKSRNSINLYWVLSMLKLNITLAYLNCCLLSLLRLKIVNLSDLVGFNVKEHRQSPPNRLNSPLLVAETTINNSWVNVWFRA